ncbi:hypothetical protein N9027_01010 [bacterium]|nr:hypothetical protein [bacterium]
MVGAFEIGVELVEIAGVKLSITVEAAFEGFFVEFAVQDDRAGGGDEGDVGSHLRQDGKGFLGAGGVPLWLNGSDFVFPLFAFVEISFLGELESQ